jgi:hypothetical protein
MNLGMAGKELRAGDFEVFADFVHKEVVDLAMARDGGAFARGAIDVYRMIAAFTQEFAAVVMQMLEEVTEFQAAARSMVSR